MSCQFSDTFLDLPGTPRALVADGGDVMLWDNDKRSFQILKDLPRRAWGTPMGDCAVCRHNGLEVWNLVKQKKIPLQLPREFRECDVNGDPAKPWALVNLKDGRYYVFDLEAEKAICVLMLPPDPRRIIIITSDGKWLICSSGHAFRDEITNELKEHSEFSMFSIERIEQFEK